MTVPIRNIYHMLCYAWDVLEESGEVEVDRTTVDALPDLLARVLLSGVRHLIRRGLFRNYVSADAEMAKITGQVDFAESIRRRSFDRCRAHCHFDEFTHDVLENRLIKRAIDTLARSREVSSNYQHELLRMSRLLSDIGSAVGQRHRRKRVTLHRMNSHYRMLLGVAELIEENCVPDETSSGFLFRDFLRDHYSMARLYEKFIYNFLRREQSTYEVRRRSFPWDQAGGAKAASPDFLPILQTDVVLQGDERWIVIDAKFYETPRQRGRFGGKRKLRADHLNQLFAYLSNLSGKTGGKPLEGTLLYAESGDSFDLDFHLGGMTCRALTINLDSEWRSIESMLLGLTSQN